MAWIESHQSLGQHPKTKRLARKLGCSMPAAVGHMQYLWWWALDYAPDGDLARFDDEDIADACQWEGEASMFVGALAEAGFLDGRAIHDFDVYVGRIVSKREANAERQRQYRERNAHVTRDKHVTNALVTGLPTQPTNTTNTTQQTEPTEPTGRVSAPKVRPLTEEAILDFEEEFPQIDVRSAAQDYLNWSGSSKHRDKVLGLRNQLKSEAVARKHSRKGVSRGTSEIASKFAAYG